jgi:hypothetical protein
MKPAIDKGLLGCLWILVITDKAGGCSDKYLLIFCYLDLCPGQGFANGLWLHLSVRLNLKHPTALSETISMLEI